MGHLQILRGFPSPAEQTTRTLRIYLPRDFDVDGVRRYPVLFMHDAQNLFDRPEPAVWPTWGVDVAMDALVERCEIEPWIVVAVDHRGVHRIADFSPWPEPTSGEPALAARYEHFFMEVLVPHVQRTLPVRIGPGSTAIAGSSLGGLISLHLARRHPDVFGRVAALSPSVMWADRAIFREWNAHVPFQRLYVDAGAEERFSAGRLQLDYGASVRDFARHLQRLGYREPHLHTVLEPGGRHSEADWRRRLPDALRYLLT